MLPGGVFTTKYDTDLAIVRTRTQWLLLGAGLLVLFVVVPLVASDYWLIWFAQLAITIIAVLGLHILSGLCGLFSMGHAAFIAVGAYTVAILTGQFGLNGWVCLPLSVLAAGMAGTLFGLPCFRLSSFYLAVSTLAAHEIIMWCFGLYKPFWPTTGGFNGLKMEPLTLGGIDFSTHGTFYILAAVALVLATYLAKNIQRTSTGRAFVAIRDNELAAEVSGIALFRYKCYAFFIGCAFAGAAGWLLAYSQGIVRPSGFSLHDSLWFIGMLAIGGWGSTTGVFLGAGFVRGLEVLNSDFIAPFLAERFESIANQIHVSLSLILVGMVIILFLRYQPSGLYFILEKVKGYYRLLPYSHRV